MTAPPPKDAAPEAGGLRRELGLFGSVSMIVGIVIGSGIFLGVNRVAAGAGSPGLMILAWVLGGVVTLMGALTYAELGVMFPRAGGEYVFLRQGMGRFLAFLSGWTSFTINLAGSAAALAAVFADQLFGLYAGQEPVVVARVAGVDITTAKLFASALVLLFSVLNWFGLRTGANLQKGLTVGKGLLMVGLAAAALMYAGAHQAPEVTADEKANVADVSDGFTFAGFFGLAMVAVFFAYDGWTNVVRLGGEVKDPSRTLPKAFLLGIGAVMALYILLSLGYLNVLGFDGFAHSPKTVASDAAGVIWPGSDGLFGWDIDGERLVGFLILLSVLGSLNGITISGPRIYYAMARDRLFPRAFGDVNRHHVPGHAIWAQAGIAIAFLVFFDFEALTDNVVFISFMFYGLAAVCLMVLRKTQPDLPRPYKVPGYPVVPILFIAASFLFVGYQFYQQVADFGNGAFNRIVALGVVAAGVPVYLVYRARGLKEPI